MAKKESNAQWKRILETLVAANIVKIVVEYSGSGDGGAIDSIEFINAAEMRLEADTIGVIEEDKEFIENQVYSELENYANWYNNDGGQGTLTINTSTGEFDCHHGSNYTETDWEDHKGSFL